MEFIMQNSKISNLQENSKISQNADLDLTGVNLSIGLWKAAADHWVTWFSSPTGHTDGVFLLKWCGGAERHLPVCAGDTWERENSRRTHHRERQKSKKGKGRRGASRRRCKHLPLFCTPFKSYRFLPKLLCMEHDAPLLCVRGQPTQRWSFNQYLWILV